MFPVDRGDACTAIQNASRHHDARGTITTTTAFICWIGHDLPARARTGRAAYIAQENLCVWNKANGGMGSLYRCKQELIAMLKKGRKPRINNVKLGKPARYRTNVRRQLPCTPQSRR